MQQFHAVFYCEKWARSPFLCGLSLLVDFRGGRELPQADRHPTQFRNSVHENQE